MPLQEMLPEKPLNGGRALVIKTYDINLAHVVNLLRLEDLFESDDIPAPSSPDYAEFVWETLSDEAREDGNLKSFSAEAFSQRL